MMARTLLIALAFGALPLAGGPAPASAQESHLVVIGGLGGTPQFDDTFHDWESRLVDAAREKMGLPAKDVIYLAPQPETDKARITGPSTAAEVKKVMKGLAASVGPGDRVLIVLVGHGSWDGDTARFLMPGPDLSAEDFAQLLKPFKEQTVALVDATSASGPFLQALSGPRRIIITATRTGGERNATLFGGYFTEALTQDGADANQDGKVSLLEAFVYAHTQVEKYYKEHNLLQTEHAQFDDVGDGKGTDSPQPGEGEGTLAAEFVLTPAPAGEETAAPALRALYAQRLRLEEQVRQLRAKKDQMKQADYDQALQTLLVQLAHLNQRIHQQDGGTP